MKLIINEAKMSRVRWSISACNEGIVSKFDGIPIVAAGTIRFHCHQGIDIDFAQKNKKKQMKDEKQVRER